MTLRNLETRRNVDGYNVMKIVIKNSYIIVVVLNDKVKFLQLFCKMPAKLRDCIKFDILESHSEHSVLCESEDSHIRVL